ncbi:MAG: hypothetical protein LBJ13_02745 [Puniceicoccales bacterium]|nr:hypothetical protein [Puniceicoccales bacterium]
MESIAEDVLKKTMRQPYGEIHMVLCSDHKIEKRNISNHPGKWSIKEQSLKIIGRYWRNLIDLFYRLL